jgi:hypothetical protein
MISIVLLLRILAGIGIVVCWAYIWRLAVRTERHLLCLKEHYDARLSALAQPEAPELSEPELMGPELIEARLKALEAERRFTEGIAGILNYSHTLHSGAAPHENERKGD